MAARDIYFEHVALHNYARCTAIDSQSTTEVSVMGPINAIPRDLEKLALAKLRRRLQESDPEKL